jgi:hypothetical protein
MSRPPADAALLRTCAFHEAWDYLPTTGEVLASLDVGSTHTVTPDEVSAALNRLVEERELLVRADRIGRPATFTERFNGLRLRDPLQPRKRRRAVSVTRILVRLAGVRFVALANTTALGNARDKGDLDFFIIVRAGTIWTTRLFGAGLFKLLGLQPQGDVIPDAVCLSYFISDDALDLAAHALPDNDPYFRHWFLSLLPLYDDGISQKLWDANQALRVRHPFAPCWVAPPDLEIRTPFIRFPLAACRWLEPLAKHFQLRWFPSTIKQRMNQDTTVIVSDQVLKFHVDDGRVDYRDRHAELCQQLGVEV